MYICIRIYMCIYIYPYIRIYVHSHMHMYTYRIIRMRNKEINEQDKKGRQ